MAFQRNPPLGLCSIIEEREDLLPGDSFRLWLGGVCERAIRPRRPWLATGGSFPLGNARHFEAKPGACTQGSRFAVPFKQQKAPAPKQGQGGFGPLRACIALGPREVWAGPRRE